jgi:hypothetical protein
MKSSKADSIETSNVAERDEHKAIENQHRSHHQPAPPYMKIQKPVEMNGSGTYMDIDGDGQELNGNDDSTKNDESEGEEGNLMYEDELMAIGKAFIRRRRRQNR